MIDSLLAFIGATTLLALSPGPDNIYVLTQSIANGSKAGLATTLGLISGCIVHTSLVAFGMSAIIATSPKLFLTIKIAGAVYLLFIAFQVFKGDSKITIGEGVPKKSYVALFKQGVIMNILNPKVTLFFLALFPGFLWEPTENTIFQFYILGILFMGVSLVIFGGISLVAGRISEKLLTFKHSGIILKWMQILVFIGIAIFILL